jgi:large subunit ribosomal protein L3
MKFILGKKLNMTQIFREDGTVVPVTKIQAGPCVVMQVKTESKDNVSSVQVGFGDKKMFRLNKPEQGHVKGARPVMILKDFRIEADHNLKKGDCFGIEIFNQGEKVSVIGQSKGKGFQGVVKRHGFSGSLATHGHKPVKNARKYWINRFRTCI